MYKKAKVTDFFFFFRPTVLHDHAASRLVIKIIDLPGGQINDPSSGKHYFLPFLPATPSSPSRTLEGLFELTRCPSWALDSPRVSLPDLQRYKDTVRGAALGAEVPGHHQQQLTQTLVVRLLKTHFFTPIFDFEKSTK